MQSTRLNTSSSSSGGGINRGNRRSSSPPNPENPNLSPPTTRTPSSPPRFIGPLPYVDPAYIRRVDSILRSFPTDTDPAEIYTVLKARLGISQSKDSASPPPTESIPTHDLPSPPSGGNLTCLLEGLPRPEEADRREETSNPTDRGSHRSKQDCGGQPSESRGREQEEGGRKYPSSSQEGPPYQPRYGAYLRCQHASPREGEKE